MSNERTEQEQQVATATTAEDSPEKLTAEAEALCQGLEKVFRATFGDQIPSRADLAEVHAMQATVRNLVERALASGAGASEQLAQLTKERDAALEAASRAKADFINYQERATRDLKQAEEMALRGYVRDLLPIFDNLELSLQDARSETAELQRVREALEMLQIGFDQVLKVRGLERLEAKGKPFDPKLHESIGERPVDVGKGEQPKTIVDELRAGYLWHGKLLRPAQVMVGKAV